MRSLGSVISAARAHHAAFSADNHPNRVAVAFLDDERRALYRRLASKLDERLSQARTVADTIAGSLVGVDALGALYTITTEADGYAVAEDPVTGVLYVSGDPIAQDPYADGFPLPAEALKIIDIYATDTLGNRYPVITLPDPQYSQVTGAGNLYAIINGFRLIPVEPPSGQTSPWQNVTSVTVTWIDEPTAFALVGDWQSQTFGLLDTYTGGLVLALAAFFARRQAALEPSFPAGLAAQLKADADERYNEALVAASREASPIKTRQAVRNR